MKMQRFLSSSIICILLSASLQSATVKQELKFYDSLRDIVQLPENEQVSRLEENILNLPDFHPAYLKYLERLYKFDQIQRGLQFFNKPHHFNPCFQNWMLGRLYDYVGQTDAAAVHFQDALTCSEPPYEMLRDIVKFADRENEKELHHLLNHNTLPDPLKFSLFAFQAQNKGRFQKAVRYFNRVGMSHLSSTALYDYGAALFKVNDMQAAKNAFLRMKQCSEQVGDSYHLSEAFIGLSCIAFEESGPIGFLELNEKAVKAGEQTDAMFPLCMAQNNLGIVYLNQDKYNLAKPYLEKAATGFVALHEYRRALKTYTKLGNVQSGLYNYTKCLAYYEKAREIAGKQNDALEYAKLILEKAELFDRMHAFHLAYKYYSEALNIARENQYADLTLQLNIVPAGSGNESGQL
ncbi:MAG: tetratricopeptide repeat protein [candidate division KSB1 bacterium]|nr:tetratricopeptide repeat protein [candidate division KSB1 bacterium]